MTRVHFRIVRQRTCCLCMLFLSSFGSVLRAQQALVSVDKIATLHSYAANQVTTSGGFSR